MAWPAAAANICTRATQSHSVNRAQTLHFPFPLQLLSNIFTPLFEVTRDPSSHPQLHLFLQGVSRPWVLGLQGLVVLVSFSLRAWQGVRCHRHTDHRSSLPLV